MKKGILYTSAFLFLLTILGLSCQEDLTMPAGDWIFWTNTPLSNKIAVSIYGPGTLFTSGSITLVSSSLPECNTAGSYTFDLEIFGIDQNHQTGTFNYTAIDSLSPSVVTKWNGTIQITSDNWRHCNSTLLHK